MGKDTLIRGTLITLVLLILLTIVMMVLIGENGLINKEKQRYNETHIEQNNDDEQDTNKGNDVVVVNK
mgnify:CR=1 FL=1